MSQASVVIAGEVTIYRVAEIRPILQKSLSDYDGSGRITLDMTDVSECDGAGMQLLMAFSKALVAAGGAVTLWNLPAAVADQFAEYGVAGRFVLAGQGAN